MLIKRDFFGLQKERGQSLVEFALILPLFALLLVGIFDLGRAFFAYIAISNAAREGARVYTFSPNKTTLSNIETAVRFEIGASTVVKEANLTSIVTQCVDPGSNTMNVVINDTQLKACKAEEPIIVTLTYRHDLILSFFFSQPLTLVRSAEMMVP